MHAQDGKVVHLDLGHGSPDILIQLQPELAGVRLGLGVRGPVVGDMLIFAGDLAAVTSIADGYINNESLHFFFYTSFKLFLFLKFINRVCP
jgi:hypothetical protein